MVSIPDIEKWDVAVLQQVLDAAKNSGHSLQRLGDGLDNAKSNLDKWQGETAEAWRSEHGKILADISDQHGQTEKVASAINVAIEDVRWCVNELRDSRAEAERMGMKIQADGTVFDPEASKEYDVQTALTRQMVQADTETRLKALLVKATATDVEVANALRAVVGDSDKIQPVPAGSPSALTPEQIEQKKNQVEAFRGVFGRAPKSPADWKTAEALDPHSYGRMVKGAPPNIVVGKVKPVPGQGVVQGNLFIPGEDAVAPSIEPNRPLFPHGEFNAGDNRGFDPEVGSEANRVQITVDYENGLVTARQNPSVNLTTGETQAGKPDIAVTQKADGGVLVQYNAADPFSPGGQDLAKALNYSVNGEIAVQPGASGPSVGGNITTFPSFEVAHTSVDGQVTSLLQSAPSFTDSEFGPMVGLLPPTKAVGDIGLVGEFNSYFPSLQSGLTTPLGSAHLPGAVPVAPPLTIVPPTLTPLGPISDIPDIPVRTPVHIPK
ncbi:hypothetical protein [Mycolicibacterium lutetiense]|uniref:WXG100 family type VII secretion target n=1 Tax=Mycolicibacterium lutetiense TaxID=1641992 RepID=A0ABS4ZU39_9MYCO|nr:hypothetical protein [Mycolicibacterium lutetiense]MBP2453003.1 hypothetical protein [Mycolicibacterium lutetiense]